jgi:hypothetical protein
MSPSHLVYLLYFLLLSLKWTHTDSSGGAAANHMAQQMASMNPGAGVNPLQPGQDPDKLYQSEAENLEVTEFFSILDGIEERVLHNYASKEIR